MLQNFYVSVNGKMKLVRKNTRKLIKVLPKRYALVDVCIVHD